MNRVNFNQTGGFPLDTNILSDMQSGYNVFNFLGKLAGNKAIISGCETIGNSVSDGVVYLEGEVMPFKGNTLGANVIIKEDTESRIFEDGSTKTVVFRKYATFGSSLPENTFAWADFKRIKNLFELDDEKATKTALENAISVLNTAVETAKTEIQRTVNEAKQRIDNHLLDHNNPHQVSAEQVGILRAGSISIGDIAGYNVGFTTEDSDKHLVTLIEKAGKNDALYRVELKQPLPTRDYIVLGSFLSFQHWNDDNDLTFTILRKKQNSFDLSIREVANNVQSVRFEYVIIKMS